MALNGWQRIWIVAAVLLATLATAFVALSWPTVDGVAQRIDRQAVWGVLPGFDQALFLPDDASANEPAGQELMLEADGRTWIDQKTGRIVGILLSGIGCDAEFERACVPPIGRPGLSENQQEQAEKAWHLAVEHAAAAALPRSRATVVATASEGWLASVILMYALGWTVAWVRRGFGQGRH